MEEVRTGHPGVREAAVFGTPDGTWVETVHAAVVREAGHAVEADELVRWVRRHKGSMQVPRSVRFVEGALPRTSDGALDKATLRAGHGR